MVQPDDRTGAMASQRPTSRWTRCLDARVRSSNATRHAGSLVPTGIALVGQSALSVDQGVSTPETGALEQWAGILDHETAALDPWAGGLAAAKTPTDQSFGSVTPTWPWYFPFLSL